MGTVVDGHSNRAHDSGRMLVISMLACLAVSAVTADPLPANTTAQPVLSRECHECKRVDFGASPLFTDDEVIKSQLVWFLGDVCKEVEYKGEPFWKNCTEELAEIWPLMAKQLFGTKDGWFDPKYGCDDLKCDWDLPEPENPEPVRCDSCTLRLTASIEYLTDPGTVGDTVSDFQFLGFCNNFPGEVQVCQSRIAQTLPRVMEKLQNQPGLVNRIYTACYEDLKCV